jgi:hypothetical protein
MARFPPARWECLPIEELEKLAVEILAEAQKPRGSLYAAAFMAIR